MTEIISPINEAEDLCTSCLFENGVSKADIKSLLDIQKEWNWLDAKAQNHKISEKKAKEEKRRAKQPHYPWRNTLYDQFAQPTLRTHTTLTPVDN